MTDGVPAADQTAPDPFHADAIAFGNLILMAYKMSNQGLYPLVPHEFPADYQIVKNVIMDDYGTPTFYGFIAQLKQPHTNTFVLVVRGTLGIWEWLIDLQSMVSVPFGASGNVGSGFAETYKSIYLSPPKPPPLGADAHEASALAAAIKRPFAEQVAAAVATHAAPSASALPPPRLSVAGHSLGSALVTLYVVDRLVYGAMPIDTFITFASPLVGDGAFKRTFDKLGLKTTYRVYDDWDPVPDLPPLSGYVAVGDAKPIKLSTAYYGWDPLCAHSMDTYLNWFDPSHKPSRACTQLIPLEARQLAAAPAATTIEERVTASPAAPKDAVTTIKQGATKITITIQIG